MLFAKSLAIGAAFVGAALAQAKIGFTQQPNSVQAGVPFTLKWAGGDNTLVTITLQQGDSNNLQTVAIITGQGTGNSYTWTPSSDLPNAEDYTLKISQGVSDVNYSGRFSLTGGSKSSPSASVSSSASVSKSSSSSPSSSVTSAATTYSVTAILNTTIVATTAIPLNATTPIVLGTAGTAGTVGSFGSSGIPITRNATLSTPTLSATSSRGSSSSASSGASSGSASGSASGTSPRASSTTSAPGSNAANPAKLASPLAFVLSAIVAIVYLG